MVFVKWKELETDPVPNRAQSGSEIGACSSECQEIRYGQDTQVQIQGDLQQEGIRSAILAACGSGLGTTDTQGSLQGARYRGTGSRCPKKPFVPVT